MPVARISQGFEAHSQHEVSSIQELASVLRQLGRKVILLKGGKSLLTQCPVPTHGKMRGDLNPSLLIFQSKEGLRFRCFGGCSLAEVVEGFKELGITFTSFSQKRPEELKETPYLVLGFDGEPLCIHLRREGPKGKTFQWISLDGTPGLPEGMKVEDLPLYGVWWLPSGVEYVIITEGEKTTHALLDWGLPAVGIYGATTVPSEKSLKYLLNKLAPNAKVYLWPDNDPPGQKLMQAIAEKLISLGFYNIYFINWEDAPPKGDAWDFAQTHTLEDLKALLAQAKPVFPPLPSISALVEKLEKTDQREWLIPNFLPTKSLVLLAGLPKSTKSLFALMLGASIGLGIPFLDFKTRQGKVLFLGLERGNLTMKRLLELEESSSLDGTFFLLTPADFINMPFPLDITGLDYLEKLIQFYKIDLVIVDTLSLFLAPALKTERALDDYSRLYPLLSKIKATAERTGATFLFVHHISKAGHGSGAPAQLKALGSIAITGVCDLVLILTKAGGQFTLEITGNQLLEDEVLHFNYGEDGSPVPLNTAEKISFVEQTKYAIVDFLVEHQETTLKKLTDWVATLFPEKGREAVRRAVYRALNVLISDGMVIRKGRGRILLLERGTPLLEEEGKGEEGNCDRNVTINAHLSQKPRKAELTRLSGCDNFVTSPSALSQTFCDKTEVVTNMSQTLSQPESKERQGLERICDNVTLNFTETYSNLSGLFQKLEETEENSQNLRLTAQKLLETAKNSGKLPPGLVPLSEEERVQVIEEWLRFLEGLGEENKKEKKLKGGPLQPTWGGAEPVSEGYPPAGSFAVAPCPACGVVQGSEKFDKALGLWRFECADCSVVFHRAPSQVELDDFIAPWEKF